jgi:hypothetical protein
MNTTPTTSKPLPATYTVVGGPGNLERDGCGYSLILLNRGGGISRGEALEDFEKLRPREIICLENPGNTWAVEALAARFPRVRFVLLKEQATPGECVNIGMEEAKSGLGLVLWSDMKAVPAGFPGTGIASLMKDPILATMPWFYSRENESMPVLQIPAFQKKKLKVLSVLPAKEISPTLFPYDYCALYCREKFLALGGYDAGIRSPWWQKADFGFRALLWGEKIAANRLFRVSASETAPAENTGPDPGYRMFFLKNLAVQLGPGGGRIPRSAFFPFFVHSGCGFFTALCEFRSARRWAARNASRFVMDSASAAENWEDWAE